MNEEPEQENIEPEQAASDFIEIIVRRLMSKMGNLQEISSNQMNHAGQMFVAENIALLKEKITCLLMSKKGKSIDKTDID